MKRRVRASTVVVAQGHLLLVRLRDPITHVATFFPPGGGVDDGETPAEAARRETLEETGLRVEVGPESFQQDYDFRWADVLYATRTHWFPATLLDPFSLVLEPVVDVEYNLGAAWLPIEDALREVAVHPDISEAMRRIIDR